MRDDFLSNRQIPIFPNGYSVNCSDLVEQDCIISHESQAKKIYCFCEQSMNNTLKRLTMEDEGWQ